MAAPNILSVIEVLEERGVPESLSDAGPAGREGREDVRRYA